ncbi:type IV pilus biogenesis protein PilM [Pandoraea communis]|uniref:type IV pilus biogenesis protein PilM n=1 Tax=Pandoraea communis TaxID=2508297 RepID=UPI0025A5EDF5|nr:type IV pilus biogenesis protein PilM [Pandoraea communis]MDM8356534.1 type IV pilus biogenesis protein PilM [Pandoraea communis]
MYALIPIALIAAVLSWMLGTAGTDEARIHGDDIATAQVGDSMLALHARAAEYARTNHSVTGPATDTAISMPTWFVRPAGVGVYLDAGSSYVYYTGPEAGVAGYIYSQTEDPYGSGKNNGGTLLSPNALPSDTSLLRIPTQVPNGAIVVMP